MARHPLPPIVGDSLHGQTRATLMKLHQQSLEKTLNAAITIVDNDNSLQDQRQKIHNKKKKKYYPWIQRDSLAQREKIGAEGSRRRQRHDNDKFIHHPFAVLYQVDLPFPGYDRDAPSFHWKYDAVVETLISNNPPSSRRSKVQSGSSTVDTSSSPAQPMIGHRMLSRAQRKDIKKVHVPKGVVMQYEGELVNFLDQLTLSDAKDEKNEEENNRGEENENSVEDSNWVIIQSTDALDAQPVESSQLNEATEAKELKQSSDDINKEDMIVKPQIFLRWDIQDQFLRFVAHALCSFYGLVSFSKTALDGKRLIYICHPTHLDSIGQLTVAPPTLTASKPEPTTAGPTRPKSPKRQSTLEHVQELPLQELDLLWDKVEPVKVAGCPRPEMTFFEYLYPSTRPIF